jgi:hypothetical protein
VYNFAVAREVVKRIYVSESLAPPSLSQYAEVYRQVWSNMTNASYWRGLVQNGQVVQVGIYGLQAYGIFKVCIELALFNSHLCPSMSRLERWLAGGILLVTLDLQTSIDMRYLPLDCRRITHRSNCFTTPNPASV